MKVAETDPSLQVSKANTVCVNTIRSLAMDAVEAANSGHPGMPMGTANIATVSGPNF